jgi:hypothetical protein
MKFLLEQNLATAEISKETDDDGKKSLHITGPFLMFDKKNKNNRIYPKKVMDEAVKAYNEEFIKPSRALGELLHPESVRVNPERACILTKSLESDGKNHYIGKAKVLSTPMGKLLESLLNDGVKMGVSSRGAASIRKDNDGSTIVQPDYKLTVAADCVFDPSVGDAFVNHIMEESQYIFIDGMYMEREVFEEQERIRKVPLIRLQEAKLQAFQNFLNKIGKPI